MKTAILFGGSGHVGAALLRELLNDPSYQRVIAVTRKELHITHTKLKILIGDYNSLPKLKEELTGDEIFIALGATDKQIERNYPVLAASFARSNGARSAFVITAVGANPHASMRYLRLKGEIEQDITALNFDHVHFFRPSMIMGKRVHYRPMERTMMSIWHVLNPLLLGPLKKYRGMKGKDIAKAMHLAGKEESEKVNIYGWEEMSKLLL